MQRQHGALAETHQRQPIWAELDSNPAKASDVTLEIRPARNLEEGTRYVVALRHLKGAGGKTLRPRRAFRILRDRMVFSMQDWLQSKLPLPDAPQK